MLTNAQLSEISRDAQIAYALDKVPSFELAFARGVEAAATAEARAQIEPLLRLGIEIVQQLIACHDEPTCAANDVGRDFVRQAGAWLGEAQKGDGHATPNA